MNTSEPDSLSDLEGKLMDQIATLEQKRADLEAVRRVKALLNTQGVVVSIRGTTTERANVDPAQGAETLQQNAPLPPAHPPQSGEVNDAVIAVVRSMEGTFDIRDIDNALAARGKNYIRSSIRAALTRMEMRDELFVDRAGQGRRPTRYTLTKK